MLMEVAMKITDEQAEELGYTKDEIELMALRIDNFIREAEFTVTGGCV